MVYVDQRALFILYHPDYTVGYGISPYRALLRFADFTAGEELHLALKYFI